MTFHSVGNVIIPTDQLMFFRGVGTPPTRLISIGPCQLSEIMGCGPKSHLSFPTRWSFAKATLRRYQTTIPSTSTIIHSDFMPLLTMSTPIQLISHFVVGCILPNIMALYPHQLPAYTMGWSVESLWPCCFDMVDIRKNPYIVYEYIYIIYTFSYSVDETIDIYI